MSLSKVIEIARGELGVTENPAGSNRVKYWEDYDPKMQGQPWCVAFLWWVFQRAGERMAFFGGGKTASCGTLLRWYMEQGLMYSAAEVQVGDVVILNFHGTKDTEHCGLVETVGKYNGDLCVWTIEGNTTDSGMTGGTEDNGGMVARKLRLRRNIVAVCRPQYKLEEPEKIDDITGHWYTDDVRWCITQGLIKCYPDGSFQPDKPVTRAELATVLRRLILMEDDGK